MFDFIQLDYFRFLNDFSRLGYLWGAFVVWFFYEIFRQMWHQRNLREPEVIGCVVVLTIWAALALYWFLEAL